MNVNAIKQVNLDKLLQLEELVALAADVRSLWNEYQERELQVPDWLATASTLVSEEIATRAKTEDMSRMKELERQIDQTKSAAERRKELESEYGEIQARLGLTAKPVKKGR